MSKPKVLFSEGSSLSARQALTVLGLSGYPVGICDPDLRCICRFSRFTRGYYPCPSFNEQPTEYLQAVADVCTSENYPVLLPVHEQAYLLAKFRGVIPAAMALADFSAFQKVQGKTAFALTLQALGLPQPPFQLFERAKEAQSIDTYPCYLKADFGTAGQGVWHLENAHQRDAFLEAHEADNGRFILQEQVEGALCQVQAVFDHGRLLGVHCTSTRGISVGGGHAARTSVNHPDVIAHVRRLGEALSWHGPIALDYIYGQSHRHPYYLEANPRLVEPLNAFYSGVNFPDLTIQAALGEAKLYAQTKIGQPGVRTHSTMAIALGSANSQGSRTKVARLLWQSLIHQEIFANSREDLTPFSQDIRSIIPFLVVTGQLLLDPRRAGQISDHSIGSYSLQAATVQKIETPAV